ncbi:MAG TPA: hypothetical protein VGC95_01260, partial [Chitinophagaceae bacterium]
LADDSATGRQTISSINTSGYHRTITEISERADFTQLSGGAVLTYRSTGGHVSFNTIFYRFSLPLKKEYKPYNQFAIAGSEWYNCSIDFSRTIRNLHFFGEEAIDAKRRMALINGALLTVDRHVDVSLLARWIDKAYAAVSGDAFTEGSAPGNEQGLYIGMKMRPAGAITIDLYTDFYRFPWLRYQVDKPADGEDHMLRVGFIPNKRIEISSSIRREVKAKDQPKAEEATHPVGYNSRLDWRTGIEFKASRDLTVRNRLESVRYQIPGEPASKGFLFLCDVIYKPALKPYKITTRWQYFETTDFDSRIYAYENDVPYSFSIPAFFGKGCRYYLLFSYEATRWLSCSARWARTAYYGTTSIGDGADTLETSHRSQMKFQVSIKF